MEIRTRVWDNTLKKFHYYGGVFGHELPFKECSNFPQYESCPEYNELEEPQLFSGYKDKNSVDVFEGDKYSWEDETGVIVFMNACFCCVGGGEDFSLQSMIHHLEIIGHVHEPFSRGDTDVICED